MALKLGHRARALIRRGGESFPTAPHPVFSAGLDSLTAGSPLAEAARPVAWRYVDDLGGGAVEVSGAERAVGSARMEADPFAGSLREALRIADEDPHVAGADYEARMLREPALSLVALWLHSAAARDLFIPLDPAPKPIRAHAVYVEEEFAAIVADLARHRTDVYRNAERPDELGA